MSDQQDNRADESQQQKRETEKYGQEEINKLLSKTPDEYWYPWEIEAEQRKNEVSSKVPFRFWR